eukprot:SAG11_NODE_19206_length_471_cov_138.822581_1_plen_42_part_01
MPRIAQLWQTHQLYMKLDDCPFYCHVRPTTCRYNVRGGTLVH